MSEPQQPFEYPPLPPEGPDPAAPQHGAAGYPPPVPPMPPQYGPPPGANQPGFYPPPPGMYGDPSAPYGRHPLTGEPYSDKSKVVAGLLQLIGLFGLLGFGRLYIGQVGLGVGQLVGCLLFGVVTCGFGFILPAIWGIIDAVIMFTSTVRDAQGRPLRDGT